MEALRRSRRAPKKQTSEFNVGDVVEIHRNNVALRAVLAQLLTEGSSVHPRWLIKFEGPYKDEEVYEHAFTKVDDGRRSSDTSSGEGEFNRIAMDSATNKPTGNATIKGKGRSTSSPVDEVAELSEPLPGPPSDDNSKDAKKSQESSPIASDSSIPETAEARRKKASAREQRSRRRQAIIDEFGVPQPIEEGSNKRKMPPHKPFKNKRPKPSGDEKCIQIKLLTGTLYLYRGPNRRAEFIRKV
ncbi:hypothetical protein FisN_5Hh356 [Fistulifera solaris]|uniref:Uncharacterized protein n=1 Tax=Fistulifera solaris TaxID=1519565 RepID=A0A1Z5JSH9_FISSO|nr:hypothetical protein FisN_5Hh356 [Fistulifera solaris]|eukprot:GAX16977.1 hypothetical protein FisN_5Hh356 [Fistulifera solaris]